MKKNEQNNFTFEADKYIYIYICIYMCVCVCVYKNNIAC